MMGHEPLLVNGAVVLQGQDHWVFGCLEKRRKQPFSEGEALHDCLNEKEGQVLCNAILITLKANSLMTLMTSLNSTLDVSVYPW